MLRSPTLLRFNSLLGGALLFALVGLSGCAAFRQKSVVPASVAACRQYACQGVTAMEGGDLEQAEELLRKAVASSPDDPTTRRHLAETLWVKGDREGAISHLDKALEHDPQDAATAARLGTMLLANKRPEPALELANRALHESPQLGAAWTLRARAFAALQKNERALADYHTALKYAPADREVLAEVAQLYQTEGHHRRCLLALHCLQDTYPPGEAPAELHAQQAEAYLALGRPGRAAEGFRFACTRSGNEPTLLFRLAAAEEAAGNPTAAVTAAQQALAMDASHAPSQQLLARLAQQQVGTLR